MICRRWGEIVSKYSSKFFLELSCELGSLVRYDFVEESESCVEFSENNGHDSFSGDGFLGGA